MVLLNEKTKQLKDIGYNWRQRYLTKYVLKTHYPLVALYVPVACAVASGFIMAIRALVFTPDVTCHKKQIPWENMTPSHRFQLFSPNIDFKQIKSERPKLD